MQPGSALTCGNHFPDPRPDVCVVCADERQWLPPGGQRWTTLADLAAAGHRSDVRAVEPGLTGIGADPPVAIGQRSLLVRTAAGNVLWDPSGFIDDAAVAAVREAGGLSFVTASHPHFYGAIAEWARVFGAEILVPADDAAWLRAGPGACGADLVRDSRRAARGDARPVRRALPRQRRAALGRRRGRARRPAQRGHDLRDAGRGPGDVRLVGAEPAAAVRGGRHGVWEAVQPFPFDRIYGGWWTPVLRSGAWETVRRSAVRYVEHLQGTA